ncbi:HdeD family acid-resistance protein [Halorubrum sp. 2020YC2]|uniref:HdeD family acid-resistance protein n=1 Tax=Halorubrum sp. 2020YC2 TaxID=2836432 RepID=UPI0020368057|nr:HdeD family acid-resistance protein [Halorubrum sp. 2020YC2]
MSSTNSAGAESSRTGSRTAAVAGTILAVLGVLAMIFPFVTGLSLSVLVGGLLVAGAIVHVLHAFSAGAFRDKLGQVILGGLYGVAGIVFITNPVFGLLTLTLLAVGFFVVDGIVEVAWGIRSRGQPGAVWVLASGSVSFLLGGLLWLGFPSDAVWAIGVLFGINLFVTGVSVIILGRGSRNSIPQHTAQRSQG